MRNIKLYLSLILFLSVIVSPRAFSQDPNFYIYLCFGQSNMSGQGAIEAQDKIVDNRFQVLEALDCSNLGRSMGEWYTAIPPLTRCYTGLSPADYFGKTMVANLPDSITIGVINVSVEGCRIGLFDKENYQDYLEDFDGAAWYKNIIAEYDGNPYGRLVELAQLAQNDGVIKGFLLHQGESDTGDETWPAQVKKVYDSLVIDLGLPSDSIPLLAGEVVHADQNGCCSSMNAIIATLPDTIPGSYVISSSGVPDLEDNTHFTSAGYRELGWRYGLKMLEILGVDISNPVDPRNDPEGTESMYFEAECAVLGSDWDITKDNKATNGYYVEVDPSMESIADAPGTSESEIILSFSAAKDTTYYIYGRLNCPSPDDDSYWLKMDGGEYMLAEELLSDGWEWKTMASFDIDAGEHTLSIAYRENGAKLDKIGISSYSIPPAGVGDKAGNICDPTTAVNYIEAEGGFLLGRNYPNPFTDLTIIPFDIPLESYVSLKIYNLLGLEIAELAGKEFSPGKHRIEYDSRDLAGGIYLYTLNAGSYSDSRTMSILDH